MAGKDRIQTIKQLISNEKKVTVTNLSTMFQVTEETIRRDLEKLEVEGFLTRTYGGAVLNENGQSVGIHFYKRAKSNIDEKRQIALKVLPLLTNKTTIAADSSTTVMELLKLLKDRNDLTILTNSTEVFRELAQAEANIVSTGGEFNKNALSLKGRIAKEIILQYHVDVLILSCKGLDIESGVLDSNEGEAEVKKVMLHQAAEVALLVDHTKFDRKAFVKLAELQEVNYIITDKKPRQEWVTFCEEHNIQLIF